MTEPLPGKDQPSAEAHAWVARLQGEPSAGDRAEFERWYAADPVHREAYQRVAADWRERYGLLAHTTIGRSRVGLAQNTPGARPFSYGLAAAAALVILVVSSLLLFRPGAEPAAEARIFATRLGEIRSITLPDASRVTLDTGSRIAVLYRQEERRVEIQEGRARFFAKAASDRPFVVEAVGGQIVARGTTFDVRLVDAGATVSLLEGAADVIVPGAGGKARLSLRPGQRVSIGSGGVDAAVTLPEAETKWPAGMLDFRGTPLRRVVAEANRYSPRKISPPKAQSLGDLKVTGTFRAGDTAGLARSLAVAFDLRAEDSGRGDIYLRPAD